MTRYFKTLVAVVGLAALFALALAGCSDTPAAREPIEAPVEALSGCVGNSIGSLTAIGTEFPYFHERMLKGLLSKMWGIREDPAEYLAAVTLWSRDETVAVYCEAADGLAGLLDALRDNDRKIVDEWDLVIREWDRMKQEHEFLLKSFLESRFE